METPLNENQDNDLIYCKENPCYGADMNLSRSGRYDFQMNEVKPSKSSRRACGCSTIVIFLILLLGLNCFLVYKVITLEAWVHSELTRMQNSDQLDSSVSSKQKGPPLNQHCLSNLCGDERGVESLMSKMYLLNTSALDLQNRVNNIMQEKVALPGPPGPRGPPGAPGAFGLQGLQGPPGSNGLDGLPGSSGLKGDPGSPGTAGEPGAIGPNGQKGETGIRGSVGSPGIPGAPGVTGIKGEKGMPGLPGITGDKGQAGEPGIAGLPGANGTTGLRGLPGFHGPAGEKGSPGSQGPTGLQGSPGEKGAAGEKGDRGDSSANIRGPPGPKGDRGFTGYSGAKGDQGSNGSTGDPGLRGPKGDTGSTGLKGQKGDQGLPGAKGNKGEQMNFSIVRLVGTSNSGRVEVMHNSVWGTVCDDSFDNSDGTVLCKMMGFQQATRVFTAPAGSGKIWLDDLQCVGTEASIFDCKHAGIGVNDCQHSEDAGISCS